MRSYLVALALVGCAPRASPPPPAVPATVPVPPPVTTPKPFAVVAATRDPRPYAPGAFRTVRRLGMVGTIGARSFEEPRRVVIETAQGWHLVEPATDRAIAAIGRPVSRMSEHELVVRHGMIESVVDLRDGRSFVPSPRLPVDAPLEALRIAHADEQGGAFFTVDADERGGDVFLIATAGGRTFVGPWNDRELRPELVHEIERPPGFAAHRRAEGLELGIPSGATCKALRLHRTRPPVCVEPSHFDGRAGVTGSWDLAIEPRAGGSLLVARDTLGAREERIAVPCDARIWNRSREAARVTLSCNDAAHFIVAWSPGRAHVIDAPDERVTGGVIGRLASSVPLDASGDDDVVATRWIDADAGVILETPPLDAHAIAAGANTVAIAKDAVAVIDPIARTVRTVAVGPCRGKLLLTPEVAGFATVTCAIQASPTLHVFDHVWSKIIDTRRAKIFDVQSYPEVVFSDGMVILSARTGLSGESPGPQAALTLIALEL